MIVGQILRWAAKQPDKTALIFNGKSVSYSAFAAAILRAINNLSGKRLPAGGLVLVGTADRLVTWVYILALRHIGLSPLAPMPWVKPSDLGIPRPELMLTFSWRSYIKALLRYRLSGTRVLRIGLEPDFQASTSQPGSNRESTDSGDLLLLSSGTTGRYKIVVVPGRYLQEAHQSTTMAYRLNSRTVFNIHGVGPWSAMGGRVVPSVWANGGTVIFDTSENRFLNIFQHGTNTTFFVPTDTPKVLNSPSPSEPCWIVMGGGFLSERYANQLAGLPNCTTAFGFGASETSGLLMLKTLVSGGDNGEHWLEPLPGRIIEVVDEQGMPCPAGEEGWLRVRLQPGDSIGYMSDADATGRAFREGYYYTGDLATRDGKGRFRINGRSEDVVILRGQKISAANIESVVRSLLGLESVCAFSGLGPKGEEQLAIALELTVLPLEEQLKEVESRLPSFESIRWVAIPEFPRTDTGLSKIRRNVLRAKVFPQRERTG